MGTWYDITSLEWVYNQCLFDWWFQLLYLLWSTPDMGWWSTTTSTFVRGLKLPIDSWGLQVCPVQVFSLCIRTSCFRKKPLEVLSRWVWAVWAKTCWYQRARKIFKKKVGECRVGSAILNHPFGVLIHGWMHLTYPCSMVAGSIPMFAG